MTRKPISNRAFSLWAFIAGLEGAVAWFFIARETSEAGNAIVFGFSFQRLVIVTGVLLAALFFVGIAIAHYYQLLSWNALINKKAESIRFILAGSLILALVILHLLFLIPAYHFPTLFGYLSQLRPVLVWLVLLIAQTFVFLAYYRGFSFVGWRGCIPVFVILGIIGLLGIWIALTGIGTIPDEFYWNVAGVPLLAGQIWMAAGSTLFVWFLYKGLISRRDGDLRTLSPLLFVAVWIIAAIVWIRTPLAPTFNVPGPYPPMRDFYPFVDAALFDLGAQSALYGKGIFFGAFIDRALLSGFLALVHKFFGQNYLVVVGVQSGLFAVFPAFLYLLGKKIHSLSAGIMVAALAIFKVSNSISGGRWISTAHPKLMLTEFPTGIVLVLITLFLVMWLIHREHKAYYLAGIGAAIGAGILLRTNVFFIFPAVFFLGVVVWKANWRRALRDTLLTVVAFFITISPWMWRSQQVANEPLFFLRRFDSVIEERYPGETYHKQNRLASNASQRALRTQGVTKSEVNAFDLAAYQFIPRHFIHNIITSVLVLPPSLVLDDFRHVVDGYPYWGRMGDSSLRDLSGSMGLFLAANLVILSIGIGIAWKRARFAALAPLTVFLFYNLANAFARTSGGRYIVPVDWVVYFYYGIGLVEIIRFCISALGFRTNGFFEYVINRHSENEHSRLDWRKAGLLILPFFLMVATLPVIEMTSPGEKPPETNRSLLDQLDENMFFENAGLSRQEVEKFLENPDALLISGRGLYPRHYSYDQGEPILPGQMSVYTAREYPRLVFTLLLPDGERPVLLPVDERRLYFPDAAEVIVAGCQVGQSAILASYFNYIDAAFVAILDGSETAYVRVPEAPLECPLREPVCDNNHNCN